MKKYDVAIIGSGPSGLTAAIYLAKANLNVCFIDYGAPGGKVLTTSNIENYPSWNNISGFELSSKLYNHALDAGASLEFGKVVKVINNEIIFENEEKINAKKIIIASGTKEIVPNIEGINKKGVNYCAICDGSLYKGENVGVIGSGNSAFEESLFLSTFCKNVYLFVRTISASPEYVERVKNRKNIKIINEEVNFIAGNEKVEFLKTNKGQYDLKAIFPYVGSKPQSDFIDLEKENGYIITNDHMKTSNNDIYAVGDVRKKEIRQITTATNDGTIAAKNIIDNWER